MEDQPISNDVIDQRPIFTVNADDVKSTLKPFQTEKCGCSAEELVNETWRHDDHARSVNCDSLILRDRDLQLKQLLPQ